MLIVSFHANTVYTLHIFRPLIMFYFNQKKHVEQFLIAQEISGLRKSDCPINHTFFLLHAVQLLYQYQVNENIKQIYIVLYTGQTKQSILSMA